MKINDIMICVARGLRRAEEFTSLTCEQYVWTYEVYDLEKDDYSLWVGSRLRRYKSKDRLNCISSMRIRP